MLVAKVCKVYSHQCYKTNIMRLSITTLSVVAFSITTLSIMTLRIIAFSITTLSIMTFSITIDKTFHSEY